MELSLQANTGMSKASLVVVRILANSEAPHSSNLGIVRV